MLNAPSMNAKGVTRMDYMRKQRRHNSGFAGIDSPYEEPEQPEIVIDTRESSVDECVTKLEGIFAETQSDFRAEEIIGWFST